MSWCVCVFVCVRERIVIFRRVLFCIIRCTISSPVVLCLCTRNYWRDYGLQNCWLFFFFCMRVWGSRICFFFFHCTRQPQLCALRRLLCSLNAIGRIQSLPLIILICVSSSECPGRYLLCITHATVECLIECVDWYCSTTAEQNIKRISSNSSNTNIRSVAP